MTENYIDQIIQELKNGAKFEVIHQWKCTDEEECHMKDCCKLKNKFEMEND